MNIRPEGVGVGGGNFCDGQLAGCTGLNSPLRQYFSLYRVVYRMNETCQTREII